MVAPSSVRATPCFCCFACRRSVWTLGATGAGQSPAQLVTQHLAPCEPLAACLPPGEGYSPTRRPPGSHCWQVTQQCLETDVHAGQGLWRDTPAHLWAEHSLPTQSRPAQMALPSRGASLPCWSPALDPRRPAVSGGPGLLPSWQQHAGGPYSSAPARGKGRVDHRKLRKHHQRVLHARRLAAGGERGVCRPEELLSRPMPVPDVPPATQPLPVLGTTPTSVVPTLSSWRDRPAGFCSRGGES